MQFVSIVALVVSCVCSVLGNSCTDSSLCNNDQLDVGSLLCNVEISPNSATSAPTVKWSAADQSSNYMLIMVDPDAPSCAAASPFWIHWIVADISGSDVSAGTLGPGSVVSYAPPSPPPSSGLHRYQFRLYEQSGPSSGMSNLPSESSRSRWDMNGFVGDNSLSLKASFQYRAQHEE